MRRQPQQHHKEEPKTIPTSYHTGSCSLAAGPMNRPRNVLLKDADPRHDVVCEFQHSAGALRHSLRIHQTPAEATWPGGVLWDCGALLSELLLGLAGTETWDLKFTLDVEAVGDHHGKIAPVLTRTTHHLSSRLRQWVAKSSNRDIWATRVEEVLLHRSNLKIVELGCGVGLTGLVASLALGACTTILTDLQVVVDSVTVPNVMENTQAPSNKKMNYRTIRHLKRGGKVVARPLCWGNEEEGQHVLQLLEELSHTTRTSSKGTRKKKKETTEQPPSIATSNSTSHPDIILLGDVAYQHKPGAPSHFDVLVETLQQLMPPSNHNTLLLFGTRLRMPASMDLLLLFEEHFIPVLNEPIPAEVLDPALEGVKHNMTIHIFTNQTAQ
eukprot:scaffold8290_cov174-Amphora_coffeaeformis.AAC.4